MVAQYSDNCKDGLPYFEPCRNGGLWEPGIAYRLRVGKDGAGAVIVFVQESLPDGREAEWVEVTYPLQSLAGEKIKVWLEVTAVAETEPDAYWANPRLVVNP